MDIDLSLTAKLRADANVGGRWGLYSTVQNKWLGIVFATKEEAEGALRIIRQANRRTS